MIYVDLKGRLGNQMFIYAFAYALSCENNNECICFSNQTDENSLFNYRLRNLADCEASHFRLSILQWLIMKNYSLTETKMNRTDFYQFEDKNKIRNQRHGLFLCQNGYLPLSREKSKKNDIYLNGYFQSERYFLKYKEDIVNIYTPIYPVMDANYEIYKEILNNQEAVCVDFRLGDYVNNPLHSVCSIEYYKQAMEYISGRLKKPVFYVFSTDVDFIKKLTENWEYNIVVEDGKSPDYEKLRLMSACKHFIISNSTYDWWAQYLCRNSNKIVIAPSSWFGLPCPCDIYQKNWILLDTQ